MTGCPSFELLQQLLADRLSGPEAEAVETHVEGCPACQQSLERLTGSAAVRAHQGPVSRGESGDTFLRQLEQEPPAGLSPFPGQHQRAMNRNEPGPIPKHLLPGEPTADEHDSGAPPEGQPGRVRVALVAGFGPVAPDDLYRLLRWRLLIVCSILGGGFVAGLGVDLLMRVISAHPEALIAPSEWLLLRWGWFLQLAMVSVPAVVLWRRPPRSVRGLRVIEVLLVGMLTVMVLREGVTPRAWGFLEDASQAPDRIRYAFEVGYLNGVGLFWFVVLTMYGAFIPNTWRRCAAMVALLGVSPLMLFAIYGYWLRPIDPETATRGLLYLGFWIGLAAFIAVFSSSRLEILQREAAVARKLGQYILKERLGTGGMGEVYRAAHILLRRPCAIKVIRPERAGDPKNLARFEREVQATAALTHPNTVEVFDYGHAADGTFYYVMEYLPGLSLEELVKQHGPQAPARVVHLLRQVCGALQEAHAVGLIHRDIKPGNILVCQRGGRYDVAKLLDFGLVRAHGLDGDGQRLTQEGALAGTPAYMSPEQASGHGDVDGRSDLYSLGAVAYFLLTGQPPFVRKTAVQTLAAHLGEPVIAPDRLRPDLPADVQAAVLRCLEKEPARRFPDADALARALACCRSADDWTPDRAAAWWRERTAENLEVVPPLVGQDSDPAQQ